MLTLYIATLCAKCIGVKVAISVNLLYLALDSFLAFSTLRDNLFNTPLRIALFVVIYIALAQLGLSLAFAQQQVSPVWPPSGLAIAVLLHFGQRFWIGVFVGAFIVNFQINPSILVSLAIAIGNTLEAVVAAILINRFAFLTFSNVEHAIKFVSILALATLISAVIGTSTLSIVGVIEPTQLADLGLTWWVGDLVGGLVVTPFLLTWFRKPSQRYTTKMLFEFAGVLLTTLVFLIVAFAPDDAAFLHHQLLMFLLLPIFAWSALRFSHHGTTLMVTIIAISAILGTVKGFGPFVMASENESLVILQASVAAVAVTVLLLMATFEERRLAIQQLEQHRSQLETLVSERTSEIEATNRVLKGDIDSQHHLSDSLKRLVMTTEDSQHDSQYEKLVKSLAETFKTKYAFFGTFANPEKTAIHTLAVWANNDIGTNFSYALAGTPCWDVLNRSLELVATGAAETYSDDEMLLQMGIDSYFGAPLVASNGDVIGIMAVMDTKPLDLAAWLKPLLGLYANRATLEIQRRQALKELELAASVFEQSSEAILICDADVNIIKVNPQFSNITGYSFEEVQGKNPRLFQSGEHSREFYAQIWQTLESEGVWQGEFVDKRKNGEVFISNQVIKAVTDRDRVLYYISIINDITEKKHAEEKIYQLAHRDLITKLPNRSSFHKLLREAVESAKTKHAKVAVMFIDLDHFKLINDTSGHPAGDELLLQVGERLEQFLVQENSVARFGGDEFTVMMPGIDSRDEAAELAQKILDALSQPFNLNGNEVIISASIGISLCPDNGASVSELLSCADVAMYQAKESGRNSYQFYTSQMQAEAHERVVIERELRLALKHEQFELHYQPQYDIKHNKIIGFEALIRWNHPDKGLIPPDKFIPIAEATGLIIPIGEWVLRTACKQHREWLDRYATDLIMAINLSARQFFQSDLMDLIASVIQETAISPSSLELEITESMMISKVEETIETLQGIKTLGVQLSIDDFGTGYSSLAYLKKLPLNKLKIDKSFIDGLPQDADDTAIVQATIAIAKSLGLTVIAEGVETKLQLDRLSQLDCDEVQGYYFSRPLPAPALTALLEQK